MIIDGIEVDRLPEPHGSMPRAVVEAGALAELNLEQLRTYAVLAALNARPREGVQIIAWELARLSGLRDENALRRIVRELEARRLIRIELVPGQARRFFLLDDPEQIRPDVYLAEQVQPAQLADQMRPAFARCLEHRIAQGLHREQAEAMALRDLQHEPRPLRERTTRPPHQSEQPGLFDGAGSNE